MAHTDIEKIIKEMSFILLQMFLINNDMDDESIKKMVHRINTFKINYNNKV
jgi:hypothetical protein